MPDSLTIKLQCDPEKRHGSYISSLLHGALMERLDSSYAEKLHTDGLHPYSQYVVDKKDHLLWTISTLDQDSRNNLLDSLIKPDFNEIHLNHREERLIVDEKIILSVSYQSLMDEYFFEKQDRLLRIRFLTPTSFKQNGRYCIFPSERLIFQSLMLRYDEFSDKHSVFSEEVLDHFEKYIHITGYNLRSTIFQMEGVRIPSFIGTITMRINGPQQLVNLAWMLAAFGRYSGVGIKVSMGMGAMDIINKDKSLEKGSTS